MKQEIIDLFNSASDPSSFELLKFLIALVLSIFFSSILKYFYLNFWKTVSDKKSISSNFVLLTLIVTIIISVVKSSLALSLGLVGALSIVRFRTPIKDPEELIFLFICIAIGLSLGAFQFIHSFFGLVFIILVILIKSRFNKDLDQSNFYLTINDKSFLLDDFLTKSSKYFEDVVLKKFEKDNDECEIIFHIKLRNDTQFIEFQDFLNKYKLKNYTFFDKDNFFQN